MVHLQRHQRVIRVLALLIAFLLGLQTGRMFPDSGRPAHAPSVDLARTSAAATTVVIKKISESFLPAEAHAAEDPPGLVRKKLPTPPAAQATEAPAAPALPVPEAPKAAAPEAVVPIDPPKTVEETPAAPKPPEALVAAPAPPPAAAVPVADAAPPPAVTAPKPAIVKSPARSTPGLPRHPFSLLLASCRERSNAEAALKSYRRLGLAPYIVLTDLGSMGVWWRTLAGAYPSIAAAELAKQGPALANAVVVKTPYTNLIGEYPSEAEATDAAAALARKGLFPYLLKGSATVLVMAGAFPVQAAAEDYRRELDALGIAARTVQR